MQHRPGFREEPNLLVLSGNESWMDAVQTAARQLGVSRVHSADSVGDVVRLLSGNEHRFSHLLLQPGSAGDLLCELVGLTAGESGSGVALVLLGEASLGGSRTDYDFVTRQMKVAFAPDASQGWLERVLFAHDAADPDPRGVPESELREALSEARIQTRYQPIVRISDRMPVGLEVLARLDHPARGTLPPHLFVPQIETAGLAAALTEAVIRRALDDWGDDRLEALGLTLSMNFPLDVLLQPSMLSLLQDLRAEAGVPAEHLIVELTESRPLSHLSELRAATERLRGWGYGLAIDDVGPHVRDHAALLDMPFNILKLDKELVHEAPDSAHAQAFLMRTIEASHERSLTIVAEGVEDAEIWARMAALGVDEAQGFLVARPLPAATVPIWHKEWCARRHMSS